MLYTIRHSHSTTITTSSSNSSQTGPYTTTTSNSTGVTTNVSSGSSTNTLIITNTTDATQPDDDTSTRFSANSTCVSTLENFKNTVNSSNTEVSAVNIRSILYSSSIADILNITNNTQSLATLVSSSTNITNATEAVAVQCAQNTTVLSNFNINTTLDGTINVYNSDVLNLTITISVLDTAKSKDLTVGLDYSILNTSTSERSINSGDNLVSFNATNNYISSTSNNTSNSSGLTNCTTISDNIVYTSLLNATNNSRSESSNCTSSIYVTNNSNSSNTNSSADFESSTNSSDSVEISTETFGSSSNIASNEVIAKYENVTNSLDSSLSSVVSSKNSTYTTIVTNSSAATHSVNSTDENCTSSFSLSLGKNDSSSSMLLNSKETSQLESGKNIVSKNSECHSGFNGLSSVKNVKNITNLRNFSDILSDSDFEYSSNFTFTNGIEKVVNFTKSLDSSMFEFVSSTNSSGTTDSESALTSADAFSSEAFNSIGSNISTNSLHTKESYNLRNRTNVWTFDNKRSINSTAVLDALYLNYSTVNRVITKIISDGSHLENFISKLMNSTSSGGSTKSESSVDNDSSSSSSSSTSSTDATESNTTTSSNTTTNTETSSSTITQDIETNYSTGITAFRNITDLINYNISKTIIKYVNSSSKTVTLVKNNNKSNIIKLITSNTTVTITDDVTNITVITSVRNITTSTNITLDIIRINVTNVKTTTIVTNITIVTNVTNSDDTNTTTTFLNITKVITKTTNNDTIHCVNTTTITNSTHDVVITAIAHVSNVIVTINSVNSTNALTDPADSTNSNSVCTFEGYISDPNSTNCTTYIACIENYDGSYTETLFTCPDNLLYNPDTTFCEYNYKCPISDSDSSSGEDTVDTFSCTSIGRFANSADNTCQSYYYCVLLNDGTYIQYEYFCPSTSVFDPTNKVCTTAYTCTDVSNETETTNSTNSTSVCTSEGYFTDPNSTNCTTYIECIQNDDGDYTETLSTCPGNSLYNPDTTFCDFNYECPTPDSDSTNPTNSSTNPEDNSTNSSSVCTFEGYIADPNSTTCTTYLVCVENQDGSYTDSLFTCPDDLLYNPDTTFCDYSYECPTSDSDSSSGEDTVDIFSCTSAGRFANSADNTCQSYYYCVLLNNGTYVQYEYFCPSTSVFDPTNKVCTTAYTCRDVSTETETINSTNSTSVCTSEGYFTDPNSTNCTTYIECIQNDDGNYTETLSTCPGNSLYNPDTTYCDFNYECPTSDSDSTNPTNSSTNPADNSTNSTSVCTSEGYFSDPNSTKCTSFIQCVESDDGNYTETLFTCPGNSLYNPSTTFCENDYQCPTSDSNSSSGEDTVDTFSCTSAGRFANSSDNTCQSYYYCVLLNNGTYIQYEYFCPSTSVFDPTNKVCTTAYTCTDVSNETETINSPNSTSVCTSEGYIADPNSTNCTSFIQCVENDDGSYTETLFTCPGNSLYNPNTTFCENDYQCLASDTNSSSGEDTDDTFSCTSAGRFANSADKSCQSYYYCVLSSNGTYVQYEYTCPSTSVFDPTNKVCTTAYTCTH